MTTYSLTDLPVPSGQRDNAIAPCPSRHIQRVWAKAVQFSQVSEGVPPPLPQGAQSVTSAASQSFQGFTSWTIPGPMRDDRRKAGKDFGKQFPAPMCSARLRSKSESWREFNWKTSEAALTQTLTVC